MLWQDEGFALDKISREQLHVSGAVFGECKGDDGVDTRYRSAS